VLAGKRLHVATKVKAALTPTFSTLGDRPAGPPFWLAMLVAIGRQIELIKSLLTAWPLGGPFAGAFVLSKPPAQSSTRQHPDEIL
jgi:hypothetical protein